jgi:hypothetical protein
MSTWVFPDESVDKKLDQLEMEWDRINLSKLDEMEFDEAKQNLNEEVEIE